MLLPPIHVNYVILVIIVLEIAVFFNQLLFFLARKHEKNRKYHMILTALLIIYNICENLFVLPDPLVPIPIMWQNILSESTGYFVTMYIPFYCYKTLELKVLRFHGRYGFLFLLIPIGFLFLIYYPLTNNLAFVLTYAYYPPAAYALWALISAYVAIRSKYKEDGDRENYRQRLWIFYVVTVWCISPALDEFLTIDKWVLGTMFNNVNFIALNSFFIIQSVRKFMNERDQLEELTVNLKQKVKERTIQLEKANEQRTNALVNLVHETKTPLTLIKNYLEEYINKYGYKEELGIVKNNIDKLNKDISNLFDLERYNKGFEIYNHNQIADFSKILKDNLALLKNYCRNKNITLRENIAEDVLIKADPGAINGIVINLTENAIKYTNEGGEINIELTTEGNRIFFSVSDNGIGITRELHERIFEPYYQINSEKGGFQGMGLGLPIVKKTVTDLLGIINIESNPKKDPGTKIKVTLQKHEKQESEEVAAPNYNVNNYAGLEISKLSISDSPYDEKKLTILVVEDNTTMVSYLFKKLSAKYNVTVAYNGTEALVKMRQYPALPDLIISDVMMDKMDGMKFAKIISEAPDYKHIPFIFLSAKPSSQDRAQGLRLGALDFIHKPFSSDELLLKISSVLENAAKQKRLLYDNALKALKTGGHLDFKQKDKDAEVANKFEQNCKTYQLTPREIDISKLISEGYSYKQIGDTLFIAERTVKKHVQNIFEKVSITNKVQLINKLES
ncbi:response regulator [Chitinophaga sp. SYP-B3965]|uniref:ATP-binding response regulator n=1 Tax=Chitinophaga sp. SYP-B3965 TaxID=2663120 RepID=UPI00129967D9|nr:ATP-binding protein [Chitinophaga sp. SYP-B3965]MRG46506.1 response regulator [Chitinophaga sp. SYP-B3965]